MLRKTYLIMRESDYFYKPYADRYVSFLKKYRYFEKAREIEHDVELQDSINKSKNKETYYVLAKEFKTDLVEADYPEPCGADAAKYRGRIFSISGKDKRFPILSQEVKNTELYFHPFLYGISSPVYCKSGQEIKFSNRPFVDNRSVSEKEAYEQKLQLSISDEQNRKEYDWIWENMPDISPKSLSGYVRMKNSNSKNYQKLKMAAAEKGYILK